MRILALDASTEMCAVALGGDGGFVERSTVAGQRHSELLLPMMQGAARRRGDRRQRARRYRLRLGARLVHGTAHRMRGRAGVGARRRLACHRHSDAGGDGGGGASARRQHPRHRGTGRAHARGLCRCLRIRGRRPGTNAWAPAVVAPKAAPLPTGSNWIGVGGGFGVYPGAARAAGMRAGGLRRSDHADRERHRRAGAAGLRGGSRRSLRAMPRRFMFATASP